jgi:acyl-coenzyme A thioesterase 13
MPDASSVGLAAFEQVSQDSSHMSLASVPDGFQSIFSSSPLLDVLGGFYSRGAGGSFGSRCSFSQVIRRPRAVSLGNVATLADIGMGYLVGYRSEPARRLLTVSMTVNYVGPAAVGDWVEVRLDGDEITGRSAFVSGRLVVGDKVISRHSAVYRTPSGEP